MSKRKGKPNVLFRRYCGLDDLYSVQTQVYTEADYQAIAEEQNRLLSKSNGANSVPL